MSVVQKCVVVGIGNPLMGDDGVGVHVARALQEEDDGSAGDGRTLDIIDGGTLGFLLLDRISGSDGMIVIDAANLRSEPGSVRVLKGEELEEFLADRSLTSVHEAGLIDLLQMLRLSGEGPRFLAVVGVQPAEVGWSTELSPAVVQTLGQTKAEVRSLIHQWRSSQTHG